MLVYLRNGAAQTSSRAATLREKLQIKVSTSPSHSILTSDQPVLALTLYRPEPVGGIATGVPISNHWYDDPEKSPRRKGESNPGSSAVLSRRTP